MGLPRILSNGLQILVKNSGKQTTIQVLDEAGNVLRTRIKSIEKSVVPPVKTKKIGFTLENTPESPNKDIFTIKKNDFNHETKESAASITDRVYIKGEKVGERIISATGEDKPMDAMKKLKGENYFSTINKILRFFKGGKLEKENQYTFIGGMRRSRYTADFELEKELKELKTKLTKFKYPLKEQEQAQQALNNTLEKINGIKNSIEEQNKILNSVKCDYYNIKRAIAENKKAQIIEKLIDSELKTPEEFNTLIKEIKENINLNTRNRETEILGSIVVDFLEECEKIPSRYKDKLRDLFDREIKSNTPKYRAHLSSKMEEVNQALTKQQTLYEKIVNRLNKKLENLESKKADIEKDFKKFEIQTKKVNTRKANLEKQIKELERKKQQQTIDFDGAKMRVGIDGIDFTL